MKKIINSYNMIMDRIDPRYLVILNHTILLVTAVIFFELRRSEEQVVFALIVAVAAELILSKITLKQQKFDIKDRILSSVVLALGTLILVRSAYWWFYGFIALIGVLSKYLFVNEKGHHYYNPTNVAIVFAIIVLPEFLNVRVDSFSTHIFSVSCIVFFGILATLRADSWRITLGYFAGICAIGIPAAMILNYPVMIVLGPELNSGIILFAFLMITDPQTSPRSHLYQWLFGFSIAAVNLVLRYEQLYYSQFMALFIVLSFLPLVLNCRRLNHKYVWGIFTL